MRSEPRVGAGATAATRGRRQWKARRTVDVHAHCHVPEANALMGLKVQPPSLVISPERIRAMDD
jgi:hypothetical protein